MRLRPPPAVVEAAHAYGRAFAGQMTAAGATPPARVLVLGAGVAGLSAIQTAKNMGAIVKGYDVRPVAREQVSRHARARAHTYIYIRARLLLLLLLPLRSRAPYYYRHPLFSDDLYVSTTLPPNARAKVEAAGGEFLRVPYEEDGSGSGGYAKEMSDE
jgi:NAD/NADP transhydrogenase alpha subunit